MILVQGKDRVQTIIIKVVDPVTMFTMIIAMVLVTLFVVESYPLWSLLHQHIVLHLAPTRGQDDHKNMISSLGRETKLRIEGEEKTAVLSTNLLALVVKPSHMFHLAVLTLPILPEMRNYQEMVDSIQPKAQVH